MIYSNFKVIMAHPLPPVPPHGPLPVPPFTVLDAMIACGIDNGGPLFQGQSPARRIAGDVFDDVFETCLIKTQDDFDDDLKQYSELPANAGRIRLNPRQKKRIKAFMFWVYDKLRIGQDPAAQAFPVAQVTELNKRYKDNKAFIDKAKTMSETAKPEQFTEKVKWLDWSPTFINFLNTIPGRYGLPLGYTCREENNPALIEDPSLDMFSNLIKMARLEGDAYERDVREVHTYIMRFISGNPVAEAKVLSHPHQGNGRMDYLALREHYAGTGFHSVEIKQAERTIQHLYYAGEKKPLMDWSKFEKELNLAFAIMERKYGANSYNNERKLRLLMDKTTRADNISQMRTSIECQLAAIPVTVTYEKGMTSFRNVVNSKAIPETNTTNRSRRLQKIEKGKKRGNNNNNYQNNKKGKRSHPNAQMIRMKDGTMKEIHASYFLTAKDWENMPDNVAERIKRERNEYRAKTGKGRGYDNANGSTTTTSISSIITDNNGVQYVQVPMQQYIQQTTQQVTQANNPQLQQGIMGGRNAQAQLKGRNTNNN